MLNEKKSIIEEALLDIKKIQDALNANTKEILRSVAREEIDSVVKESLMEIGDDFEEEDVPVDGIEASATEPEMGMDAGMGGDDMGGAPSDDASLAGDMGMSPEVEPEMGQELGMGADDALDGVNLDMTAASDNDVIAIYKKLSGEDEIEIVNGDIHLNVSEPGEYVIKSNDMVGGPAASDEPLGGIGADGMEEVPTGGEEGGMGSDLEEVPTGGDDEEGVDYEIEMGDDVSDDDSGAPESGEEEEEEIEEQISVNRVGQNRAGGNLTAIKGAGAQQGARMDESILRTSKLLAEAESKYKTLLAEAQALKLKNEEYKNSLKEFKGQLLETVVGNHNLTNFVKLVTEHSTTKAEKEAIMQRFDAVTDPKQSKALYKTIKGELMARKPINEVVGNKIIKEVTTGTSKILNETTAYVDSSTQRIKDLINRVENR